MTVEKQDSRVTKRDVYGSQWNDLNYMCYIGSGDQAKSGSSKMSESLGDNSATLFDTSSLQSSQTSNNLSNSSLSVTTEATLLAGMKGEFTIVYIGGRWGRSKMQYKMSFKVKVLWN